MYRRWCWIASCAFWFFFIFFLCGGCSVVCVCIVFIITQVGSGCIPDIIECGFYEASSFPLHFAPTFPAFIRPCSNTKQMIPFKWFICFGETSIIEEIILAAFFLHQNYSLFLPIYCMMTFVRVIINDLYLYIGLTFWRLYQIFKVNCVHGAIFFHSFDKWIALRLLGTYNKHKKSQFRHHMI